MAFYMSLISFDKKVYSLAAIQRASYELPKGSSPKIVSKNDLILVETSDATPINVSDFNQSVLDHQLRLEAEEKYGLIRTILVAQAIEPSGDLDSVVSLIKIS
ncbi:MAG: hypothetical protein JEY79_17090 [Pseudodesulfovibrio sp.]|nr:hypothetical protein [Pseudodesulfovibrio sp.]